MLRLRFTAILITGVFLSASAFATIYMVGTCQPKKPSYATISQAVSSVPAGSTIEVCPGNYPEQVLITQPLTLEGIPGGSGVAVVVVPARGVLTQYVQDVNGNDAYSQILVQNTTGPVTIHNLAVDGTGGSVPPTDGNGYLVGIYYQNASGSVTNASVRNQTWVGTAVGIYADGTGAAPTLTVEDSVVRNQDFCGIIVDGQFFSTPFTPTIKANTVDQTSSEAMGISLDYAGGIVQSNTIISPFIGVGVGLLVQSSTATVSSNTIYGASPVEVGYDSSTFTANTIVATGSYPWAFYTFFSATNLHGNKIDAGGQEGVLLIGSGSVQVQSNTIVNSSMAVDGSCGQQYPASGSSVTGNTIIDANIGIKMPSSNTTKSNSFYATASAVAACP
jgi:hypothetical protein